MNTAGGGISSPGAAAAGGGGGIQTILKSVWNALLAINSPGTSGPKKMMQANQYLMNLKHQLKAANQEYIVASTILNADDRGAKGSVWIHMRHFAAQIWGDQLKRVENEDILNDMKTYAMQLMLRYGQPKDRVVFVKLCVILARIAIKIKSWPAEKICSDVIHFFESKAESPGCNRFIITRIYLVFLKTLPEEISKSDYVGKKRIRSVSVALRKERLNIMNTFSSTAKQLADVKPQNPTVVALRVLVYQATLSWKEAGASKNVGEALADLKHPIIDLAAQDLALFWNADNDVAESVRDSASNLIAATCDEYQLVCTVLHATAPLVEGGGSSKKSEKRKKKKKKGKKKQIDVKTAAKKREVLSKGDKGFADLDSRLGVVGTPIANALLHAQKGTRFDAARAAVTALAAISKVGMARMLWLTALPDAALDKVKKSFACRSLDLLIQFTNVCRDWDTVVDVLLPLWGGYAESLRRPQSESDKVAIIMIEFGVMVFDNLSNHGLFPSPEADSWTTGCPEHFRDRRNRVRQVTTPLGHTLVRVGFGKALADRIVEKSTYSLIDGSVPPNAKSWRKWDCAMWKLRCAAHAIPNEVGAKMCQLIVHYQKANGGKFDFHPLLHGTVVDAIRWTSAWWVSSRDWNKLSIVLQVLIEGIPSVTKLSDAKIFEVDTYWFVGVENNDMMQAPLVQASSCAAMTFDHLCSSCKALGDFPVQLFKGLWGFASSLIYRPSAAGQEHQERQFALLAHIRRPLLRGFSKLASRFKGSASFNALGEISKVAWAKVDNRIRECKAVLTTQGALVERWLVEIMRASASLEAVFDSSAATFWKGRGDGVAFLNLYWPKMMNLCQAALEVVKINVARSTRFVPTSKIEDGQWITAFVARIGNLGLGLIRFAIALENGKQDTAVSNASMQLLQFLLQVYANRVDDLPLSIAADLVHLVGHVFRGDTLARVLESVFAPTMNHLRHSKGPDGAPGVVVAFFKLMTNVCALCADSHGRAPSKTMKDAGHQLGSKAAVPMLDAAILCLESAPQHRAAGSSILEWIDLVGVIAATKTNPLGKALLAYMTNSPSGQRLLHALFQGGCGKMPSWMIIPLAGTIHSVFKCCGVEKFRLWATQSLLLLTNMAGDVDEGRRNAFVRRNVEFICKSADSAPRFRRAVKAACGGKKKGKNIQQPKITAGHKAGALYKKKKGGGRKR
eukprot:g1061.t1